MKKGCWRIFGPSLLLLLLSFGCGEQGKVDQGRAIEFDKAKGIVTLIRDASPDPNNPDYSTLPPLTFAIPADPEEMGPDPKAGYRMNLDTKKNQIVIFDPSSQGFKTIQYVLIDCKENIAREDRLVFDKVKKEPRKFPVVDRKKRTISIYSARQKLLITLSVAEEYFALPDRAWEAGDEIRIYSKEKGKAVRLMNISKTDIYRK
jgi:hypothetical protein